jgi:hypothetical protein
VLLHRAPPHDEHQIHPIRERPVDDARQDAPAALAVRGARGGIAPAVTVEMDVGGVQRSQGPSGRGHGV